MHVTTRMVTVTGGLEDVDLIYVPEPPTFILLLVALMGITGAVRGLRSD